MANRLKEYHRITVAGAYDMYCCHVVWINRVKLAKSRITY